MYCCMIGISGSITECHSGNNHVQISDRNQQFERIKGHWKIIPIHRFREYLKVCPTIDVCLLLLSLLEHRYQAISPCSFIFSIISAST
jgi:hypothetical protein